MESEPVTHRSANAGRIARRRLAALLWAPAAFAVITFAQAGRLNVAREGDRLRFSAPALDFLSGAPMEQLRDGRSVTYVFTVSLQAERGQSKGTGVTRQVVFSYDLWEERFAVVRSDDSRTSASHLTAAAAEAWCIDLLSLPASAAPADRTFVVRLECFVRESDDGAGEAPAANTLAGLIDLLSRKPRQAAPRWEAVSEPLRLQDLQ